MEFDLSMIDELTQSNQAELSLERAVVGLLSCRRGSGLCQIIKQTLTEVERPHEKMILILGWREAEQQENWCQSILLCRLLITQTYKNPHHKASSPNRLEKNAHYSSIMKRTNRWQQNTFNYQCSRCPYSGDRSLRSCFCMSRFQESLVLVLP